MSFFCENAIAIHESSFFPKVILLRLSVNLKKLTDLYFLSIIVFRVYLTLVLVIPVLRVLHPVTLGLE